MAQGEDEGGDAPALFEMAPAVKGGGYRVLARRYRPQRFEDLIGQEAMVRTLTNAFAKGRIAHAFMLTGVRGIGKTTTARIIARALNYEGPNGEKGPTVDMPALGRHCAAIAESRHPDVLEMDAASRTGINDIREIIEGVRYAPVSARMKVYIIDEVHMLSTAAFNGLLKTLEEPPPHVKFIFATTEIRKVPVTVLSRCQRFDLRRIEPERLRAHLLKIAGLEGVSAEEDALRLIVRASEGSVRDALSLLDQAIAVGEGQVTQSAVAEMLGLADRTRMIDLFELVMSGRAGGALTLAGELARLGADGLTIGQDLLALTHLLTRLKLVPGAQLDTEAPQNRARLAAIAAALGAAQLARVWAMLLKGLGEVQSAPQPFAALEMLLVRIAHLADLPGPEELIKRLETGRAPEGEGRAPPPRPAEPASTPRPGSAVPTRPLSAGLPQSGAALGAVKAARLPAAAPPAAATAIPSFEALVRLAEATREAGLAFALKEHVHLVHFERGRIEFTPAAEASADLASRLGRFLQEVTGERWMISVKPAAAEAAPSLRSQRMAEERRLKDEVKGEPLVKAILEAFPGAEIIAVKRRAGRGADNPPTDDLLRDDSETGE